MDINELLTHAGFVRALSRSLVFDEHLAEDMAQETYLAALTGKPSPGAPIRAWLASVLKNIMRMTHRSDTSRSIREMKVHREKKYPSPEEIACLEESRRHMVEAVLSLREPYRETILLRFYQDLPISKVAEETGTPLNTVKTRIRRGLEQVRLYLDEKHGGGRKEWCSALLPLAGLSPKALPLSMIWIAAALLIMGTSLTFLYVINHNLGGLEEPAPLTSSLEATKKTEPTKVTEKTQPSQKKAPLDPTFDTINITGNVLSKNSGEVLSNVKVIVHPLPYGKKIGFGRAATNNNGAFSIMAPLLGDNKTTAFCLTLSCERFQSLKTSIPYDATKPSKDWGSFYLDENRKHVMRIQDSSGNSVSGAKVQLIPRGFLSPLIEKISDGNGLVCITDEEISWNAIKNSFITLYVTAPGMTELFYMNFQKEKPCPERVTMHPENRWSGVVLDQETGKGVGDAQVRIRFADDFAEAFDVNYDHRKLWARTDGEGRFSLPRIDFYGKDTCILMVIAEGYNWYESFEYSAFDPDPKPGVFPKVIELKRSPINRSTYVKCRAMDKTTGQPLAGVTLQPSFIYNPLSTLVTDESGVFQYRDRPINNRLYFRLVALEKNLGFSGMRQIDQEQGPMEIPFNPVFIKGLNIVVMDELMQPVTGAKVDLQVRICRGYSFGGGGRYTGLDGSCNTNTWFSNPAKIKIKITHPEFEPLGPKSFSLEKGGEEIREFQFVLKRGFLYQGFKVVNQFDKPSSDVMLMIKLVLGDGSIREMYGLTDERGLCNMSFPLFRQGHVSIYGRPDIYLDLSPAQVFKQKRITIIAPDQVDETFTIKGCVLNEEGKPHEKLSVTRYQQEGARDNYLSGSSIQTNPDGSFSFSASKGKVYKLGFFVPIGENTSWSSLVKEVTDVTAGAELNITIDSRACTGVQLSAGAIFTDLRDKKGLRSKIEYNAYLTDENGEPVDSDRKSDLSGRIIFMGLPVQKVRGVVETARGHRYTTGLFELKKGKVLLIEMDIKDH